MGGLSLVKYHHACVVISSGSTNILVDPGSLGPRVPLHGISALLVTHDHDDHADPTLLADAAQRSIPIWMPPDAVTRTQVDMRMVRTANPGDSSRIGDVDVVVLGEQHAAVHPTLPGPANRAYLVGGHTLITGDEHPATTARIDTLVTPIDAPWLRATDLISYVQQVRPRRVIGVHDGLLNEDGRDVARRVLESLKREGVSCVDLPSLQERLALDAP